MFYDTFETNLCLSIKNIITNNMLALWKCIDDDFLLSYCIRKVNLTDSLYVLMPVRNPQILKPVLLQDLSSSETCINEK